MTRRNFFLMLLLLSFITGWGQTITDDLMQHMHESAAQQIEDYLSDSTETEIEGDAWDDIFRTSDLEGERATRYSSPEARPPEGERIGCICMDGQRQDNKGWGACSGHGGVRYWLYEVAEDSIVAYATDRHWEHPDAYDEADKQNLAAYNSEPDDKKGAASSAAERAGGWMDGFFQMIIALMVCLTVAYVARLWFTNVKRNDELLH